MKNHFDKKTERLCVYVFLTFIYILIFFIFYSILSLGQVFILYETIQHSRIGKYFLFLFLNIFTSIFFLISNNLFILFFNLNIFFRFGSGPTV